jgi:EmrB/QacA subfamily drug resistance transporter
VAAAASQLPRAETEPSPWAARLAILAVGSALLVQFIDQTALATALPTLAVAFRTDPVHLKLALTSYMLVQAVIVPASGWAADRFGARRVFIIVTLVFVIGSVLCGLSRSLGTFVLFRILQGAGAAMMIPLGRAIVVGVSPRESLVKSMILLTTPAMIGPLIGPPLTGFILAVASWPWVFYLNVPVGLFGMIAVHTFVPKIVQPHPGRFDSVGFGLAAVAITAAMSVSETIGFALVSWKAQLVAALIAAGAGAAFLVHSRRAANPVLDLDLFRLPTFRASLIGGVFVRVAVGGMPFLLPLLLQIGCGWSPLQAGSMMVSAALGSLMLRPVAPMLIRGLGFRRVLAGATVAYGLTCLLPVLFRPDTPVPFIVAVLLLYGVFGAITFTALNTIAYAETAPEEVSRATTLYAVVQQLALSLGVTVAALLLQLARLGGHGRLTADRFILPFGAVAAIALAAIPFFLRLDPRAGENISGRAVKVG